MFIVPSEGCIHTPSLFCIFLKHIRRFGFGLWLLSFGFLGFSLWFLLGSLHHQQENEETDEEGVELHAQLQSSRKINWKSFK